MTIHKEGRKILATLFTVLVIVNFALRYFLPVHPILHTTTIAVSVIIFLLILQFFRHPKRNIPYNENHIIAPADGKVVVIEETTENEYFKDKRLQVSVFMSPVNVHVNRYPISGKISFFKYHPGLFLVAWHPKSSTDNERTTLVIENEKSAILVRQIAGALARRIIWYCKEGLEVKQGDELGFIRFGSRVDLFLPIGTKVNVKLGQQVKGGETVIAGYQM
jgi:phosphatidylserine decarboxylase